MAWIIDDKKRQGHATLYQTLELFRLLRAECDYRAELDGGNVPQDDFDDMLERYGDKLDHLRQVMADNAAADLSDMNFKLQLICSDLETREWERPVGEELLRKVVESLLSDALHLSPQAGQGQLKRRFTKTEALFS